MEWALLLLLVAAVAAYVLWPHTAPEAGQPSLDELREEHARLLVELRELDDDAAAGRISSDDRRAGRRALGARLRAATEALRERGEATEAAR